MIDLSRVSNASLAGRLLRAPLRLLPRGLVVPVAQGPLRGARWLVGSATHGCWVGCYEARTQALCARLIRSGMTVYDLGANVGFYTLLFSRLVGPGNVVAFEPVARNSEYLRQHLKLNRVSNVLLYEVAVAHVTGVLPFDQSPGWSMGRIATRSCPEAQPVPAVTLDDFVYGWGNKPPDLVKMDVEGGEVDVLSGMPKLLLQSRPVLVISVHGSSRWRACVAALQKARYELRDLGGRQVGSDVGDQLVAVPEETAMHVNS